MSKAIIRSKIGIYARFVGMCGEQRVARVLAGAEKAARAKRSGSKSFILAKLVYFGRRCR